jgi:hypothetical protein
MPGLGTTPDESGLKSPSGGAVHSPGIYARAKVGQRLGCHFPDNLSGVNPMSKIDDYELEVLNAYEKGQLKSVATKSELAKLRAAARATAIQKNPAPPAL